MTGDRLTTTLDYKAIQLPRNDGYNPNDRPRKAKYNLITCQRAAESILVAIAKTPSVSQALLALCRAVALENGRSPRDTGGVET